MTRNLLWRYGCFGIPLAFAGLPIYIHIPKYYSDLGLASLSQIGAALLIARLIDGVQDPLLGWLLDRCRGQMQRLITFAAGLLIIGYLLLCAPPDTDSAWVGMAWLVGTLVLATTAYSFLFIALYSYGVELGVASGKHVTIASYREIGLLSGVIAAAALPSILQLYLPLKEAFIWFGFVFAVLMGVAWWLMRGYWHEGAERKDSEPLAFKHLFADRNLRWLYTIFFFNALPVACTSTLFLFYVDDVLQAEGQGGPMLIAFFVASALSVPIWRYVSHQIGSVRALYMAMTLAIVSFIWAAFLGPGDAPYFYVISALSGAAVAADLLLLPAIYASLLEGRETLAARGFGVWNVLTKTTLALAGGLALPLLQLQGYTPDLAGSNVDALRLTYALIPCGLKLIAMALLYRSGLQVAHK